MCKRPRNNVSETKENNGTESAFMCKKYTPLYKKE